MNQHVAMQPSSLNAPLALPNGTLLFAGLPDWTGGTQLMTRWQALSLQALGEILDAERTYLLACASSSLKLAECMMQGPGATPLSWAQCYGTILNEVAEASLARMERVTELSLEFRQQLWEEI